MRKRTPRKTWHTRRNPIIQAVQRQALETVDPLTLKLQIASAFHDLAQGHINAHVLGMMGIAVEISEQLAAAGVGPEVAPVCRAAHKALRVLATTGKADALTIQTLGDLVQWHDAQHDAAPDLYLTAALPFMRFSIETVLIDVPRITSIK